MGAFTYGDRIMSDLCYDTMIMIIDSPLFDLYRILVSYGDYDLPRSISGGTIREELELVSIMIV